MKLVSIKDWLDTQDRVKTDPEVHFKQAIQYFNSGDPRESQYGKTELFRYLGAESNSTLKNERYRKFLSETAD
jgi:hypothetical protein